MKGDKEQKFWIIVEENFPTRVSFKHSNIDDAMKEAKRLARAAPNVKFTVMESVCAFKIDNMVEIEYVDNIYEDDNSIPF